MGHPRGGSDITLRGSVLVTSKQPEGDTHATRAG